MAAGFQKGWQKFAYQPVPIERISTYENVHSLKAVSYNRAPARWKLHNNNTLL